MSSGLNDTYTINYTDGTTSTFTVTNGASGPIGPTGLTGATGNGIQSITKTGTAGNVDTYTITYTDGNTFSYDVTNGVNGADGVSPTVTATAAGSNIIITVVDGSGTHNYPIPTTSGEVTQVPADWNATSGVSQILNKPTVVSAFTNDAGYITAADVPAQVNADWNATSGKAEILNKPTLAPVATSGQYSDLTGTPTIPAEQVNADWNATSGKAEILNKPTLAPVAISGDWSDLNGTPTIPAEQVNADWNATSGKAEILNKPTIPTVNDATLTIKQDGTVKGTFTANQGTNQTIEITSPAPEYQILSISNDTIFLTNGGFVKVNVNWDNVANKPSFSAVAFTNEYGDLSNRPTQLSDFTNNQGFITAADVPAQVQSDWSETDSTSMAFIHNKPAIPTVPTNLSSFNNDEGFITTADIPAQVQADWEETNTTSGAYIQHKPDLSQYLTTADMSNYVTKTEDESVGGDKTFTDNVSVAPTGSLEVPSVLDNVGSNGTLNLSTSTGTGDCEQAVNFCDLQNVYNSILAKFNELNDQIDDLLDSIKDLNKELNTPKDGVACPNSPTVSDNDGNTYSTVRIGNQCWMRENMRTIKDIYGDSLATSDYSLPSGGESAVSVKGYLYTFYAASNGLSSGTTERIRGICPLGWHLPTSADWEELSTYVQNQEKFYCNNNSTYVTKALSSPIGWSNSSYPCSTGNHPEENNATGFTAIPTDGGEYADFWASNLREYYIGHSNYSINSTSCSAGSKWSVRCLRDNSNGENNTVYAPTVETIDSVKNVTQNSAWILGGKITDNGGMPISSYGFVVGTSASVTYGTAVKKHTWSGDPTLPKTMTGATITDLTTNTQYYYRAFAINTIDTAYGEAKAFHTVEDGQPCPGLATVTDIDGNIYNTVMIGSQCWLKENLKVTKAADNTPIVYSTPTANSAYTGKSYTWTVAMNGASATSANPSGVRGICPVGWHIPSVAEWQELITYAGSNSAKKLAATSGWTSSSTANTPGNNQSTNNSTGLNFLVYQNSSDSWARMWATDADGARMYMGHNSTSAIATNSGISGSHGVRCLKDASTTASSPKLPTVEITNVAASTDASYQKRITARVTNTGGDPILYRRIYYSNTPHPSPSNYTGYGSFTDNNAGNFISTTNLEANTTYYVRAAAQNSVGWSYSDEISFTTPADGGGLKCPGTPTVTDKNSYTYTTVQIGTQCWMAQNLRSTTYPGGGSITCKTPNGGSLNANYGRLYSNNAAMNGTQKVGNESVQGICPSGWHLPSEAEVNTLKTYLSAQSGYVCNSNTNNIAKSLASKSGWTEDATTCAVGNNLSANNATGFNAYPAGIYSGSNYQSYGQSTHFILDESGKHLSLAYVQPSCFSWANNGDASVRCIKGATPPSVATNATVTNKTGNSATVSGSLYTDGINSTFNASSVTQLGICYGTSPDPTTANSTKTVTVAQGAFTATLTGLSQATTYYYRAYATNANGTSYGEVKSFTTKTGAKVNTNPIDIVGKTTATLKGYLYPNDATITGWGFYIYKQNADGTYPSSYTADLWTESTVTGRTQGGITYNFNSAPQSGMYYFYITGGLDSGATYKVISEISYSVDGVSSPGWVTTSTKTDGTPYEYTFTTLAKPNVTTTSATYPGTGITYTLTGNVVNAGVPAYTEKGFIAGTSSTNLTIDNFSGKSTYSGTNTGTGSYTCNYTISSANALRYYRAYAKCSDGTYVYGEVKSFTTPKAPTITFTGDYESPYNYSSNVTSTSIKMKNSYTSTGGSNLTERGFIFTTNASLSAPSSLPTTTNASDASTGWVKCTASSASTQEATMTGLSSNTTYYIRAYAKNAYGVSFSSLAKTVKTKLTCGQNLTDQQGNAYGTVSIGGKCWTRQNMKANKYDDQLNWSTAGTGTALTVITGTGNISTTSRYAYYPNNNNSSSNVSSYGYLYNWPAATGYGLGSSSSVICRTNTVTAQGKTQGICPRGWHVPTTAELTTLRNNISGYYSYFNSPAGRRLYTGTYTEFNSFLNLWSCTEYNTTIAWGNWFDITHSTCGDNSPQKSEALSVRCVQD